MNVRDALVVGGAGFVGGQLCRQLLDLGAEKVTVVDNLMSGDPSRVPQDARVEFIYGSIADPRVLQDLSNTYDYVWHLACYHGNQSSIANPLADLQNNLLTSLALFDYLARCASPKQVVYAAAGCAVAEKVYGEAMATTEDAPVSLFHDSPYSISKLAGEMYGNFFWASHGLPVVKARFQNVYGPGEILGAGQWRGTPSTVWRNVVPTFIWRALQGDPLRLDNGGSTSRDFIFVEDICSGLLACADLGQPGQAYNLSTGNQTTIRELAEIILEETGSESELEIAPKRPWDGSGNRFGDPTKSRDELGFSATTSLERGIRQTIAWTRHNERLISGNITRHARFLLEQRESGLV